MLQIDMAAQVRKDAGKGAARSARRAGNTPAVIYGGTGDATSLVCNTRDLTRGLLTIHRKNAIINLEIDDAGKKSTRHVITREIQTDPVQDTVLHADFYEISLESPMVFRVPLQYSGKAKGVDMGGDMTIAMHSVTLKGKALDIPDFISIDVTPLGPGATLTCAQLAVPAEVTLVNDVDAVCVSISGGAE
jgi:large subunit ribosomal protein L25